ncbi:phospholipid carrier-dependent glycosyltransferase [Erythrobacter sp. LQ02-29]|uniref:phospholipid carrier-dependent glycosyltransferase n=1 Tax=Erythrobacter sp. LQ02-29 TaxID=2920384 RepID=UPI001F4D50A3|nr:phospholipid carrier-dependent glycosyltransferase [Erythrobacter sp. LQ02-29]MCP9222839.1 phospholipid carrier-dependent glycosyltransferase [Erythrobacter sp. LQ02-29]
MNQPRFGARDPLIILILLTLAFAGLCAIRLDFPAKLYFDEVHYIPAARQMLAGTAWKNAEHPPLAKEILVGLLALFGDRPLAWRIGPLIAASLTLFAFSRALWLASLRRAATIMFALLLATGFILFVQARIAMLDMFMVGFVALATWQFAAALRHPQRGRTHLVLTGIAMGAALACKWNAGPLVALPGLTFLVWRGWTARHRLLFAREGGPVPGVSLIEAGVWLGLLPIAVYAATFIPALWFAGGPFTHGNLFEVQKWMVELQESVRKPHPYQSQWYQWVTDSRAIWYLYEKIDGAQRGVMLIGNPFTMLAGLPAVLWCAWAGFFRKRADALAVFALYAVAIGTWIVAAKPIQFYYHYFLPSCFLLAALALALDALWNLRRRWAQGAVLLAMAASIGLFAWFYPILSAAPLHKKNAFTDYAWFKEWK